MSDPQRDNHLGALGFLCLVAGVALLGISTTLGIILISISACLVGYFYGRGPRA